MAQTDTAKGVQNQNGGKQTPRSEDDAPEIIEEIIESNDDLSPFAARLIDKINKTRKAP